MAWKWPFTKKVTPEPEEKAETPAPILHVALEGCVVDFSKGIQVHKESGEVFDFHGKRISR